jgi:NTP pyrophosphatase (non-canonical NTP hydrolase)
MTPQEYIKNALRTETQNYLFHTTKEVTPRIEHAIMGMVTESAELMAVIKKTKIYGKDLDKLGLIDEAGDVMWYLAILADELGVSFEDLWEKNVAKLTKRYPEKFSSDLALNRDMDGERKILES